MDHLNKYQRLSRVIHLEKLRSYFLNIIHEDYKMGLVERPNNSIDDYLIRYYTTDHIERFYHFLNTFFENRKKSNILSIGCGGAAYLEIFLEKVLGHRVIGADYETTVFQWNRRNAKRGIKIYPYDLDVDELPFKDEQFDIIVFTEILEHLRNNHCNALKKLGRVLKKNGSLLLSTPNIGKTDNIKQIIKGEAITLPVDDSFYKTGGASSHFHEYTIKELKELLKRAGFEPKYISMFSRYGEGLSRFRCFSYYVPRFRETIMVEAFKKT